MDIAALAGSNTQEIQRSLEKYLATKRIDALFTNMTESVLLFQPDNPVSYIRRYLLDNYPGACREALAGGDLSADAPTTTSYNDVDLTGVPQTESSGEELTDDEMEDLEDSEAARILSDLDSL